MQGQLGGLNVDMVMVTAWTHTVCSWLSSIGSHEHCREGVGQSEDCTHVQGREVHADDKNSLQTPE